MSYFKKIFQKWEIVYSTHDIEEYYKAKEKLSENNVTFRTDSISSGGGQGGGYGFSTTYQIKVKEEDVRKGNEAIYH